MKSLLVWMALPWLVPAAHLVYLLTGSLGDPVLSTGLLAAYHLYVIFIEAIVAAIFSAIIGVVTTHRRARNEAAERMANQRVHQEHGTARGPDDSTP